MRRKLFWLFMAFLMLTVCSVRVPAQELVRLPAGAFCTLEDLLETTEVQAAAVTLLPEDAVLWLDGPLKVCQSVAAGKLSKLYVFAPGGGDLGVTLLAPNRAEDRPRIRCVNPVFSEMDGER